MLAEQTVGIPGFSLWLSNWSVRQSQAQSSSSRGFLSGFRLRGNAKAAQSRWIEIKLAKLLSMPIAASQSRPSARSVMAAPQRVKQTIRLHRIEALCGKLCIWQHPP
jgi:hypothetical protein